MVTVTIPQKEYDRLLERAFRYEYVKELLNEDIFGSPPARNAKRVMEEFKKSRKYTKPFLRSLERGLKRSSYFSA